MEKLPPRERREALARGMHAARPVLHTPQTLTTLGEPKFPLGNTDEQMFLLNFRRLN